MCVGDKWPAFEPRPIIQCRSVDCVEAAALYCICGGDNL